MRSPCLACENRDKNKNECAPQCKAIEEYMRALSGAHPLQDLVKKGNGNHETKIAEVN